MNLEELLEELQELHLSARSARVEIRDSNTVAADIISVDYDGGVVHIIIDEQDQLEDPDDEA